MTNYVIAVLCVLAALFVGVEAARPIVGYVSIAGFIGVAVYIAMGGHSRK